jgi:hypothetical protein
MVRGHDGEMASEKSLHLRCGPGPLYARPANVQPSLRFDYHAQINCFLELPQPFENLIYCILLFERAGTWGVTSLILNPFEPRRKVFIAHQFAWALTTGRIFNNKKAPIWHQGPSSNPA